MALGPNFNWQGAYDLLGLDSDYYENEDQRREDFQARWDAATPEQRRGFSKDMVRHRPKGRTSPGGAVAMNAPYGLGPAVGTYNMGQALIGQQAAHLGGMVNQTTGAMQDENEKRAAVAREMRRMEHEQRLKAMEQETERMKIDALLSRLNTSRPDGSAVFTHTDGIGWR